MQEESKQFAALVASDFCGAGILPALCPKAR
jgi:hypothetical protein